MHRSNTTGVRITLLAAVLLIALLIVKPALAYSTTGVAPHTGAQRSSPAQAVPMGDIERGPDLFMGNLHFQNGGPPCMSCQNIGSNGLLGGGAMGPDLTNVSSRYSEPDLAALLTKPGPVMTPIYAEHALTAEEQADLLAFLQASAGQPGFCNSISL